VCCSWGRYETQGSLGGGGWADGGVEDPSPAAAMLGIELQVH